MRLSSKISFTLGVRTLLLVLLLGFAMSLLQTYFDFKERSKAVNSSLESTIDSIKDQASNAVWKIDEELATIVIKGLTNFDYFVYVAIEDDSGNILAQTDNSSDRVVNPILQLFLDKELYDTEVPLYYDDLIPVSSGDGVKNFGKLIVRVDNYIAHEEVYYRAIRTFAISLTGYVFISLSLVLLYHFSLAAPLTRLASRFERVNTSSIAEQSISKLKGHETDEFGKIIDSANDLLERIASGQILATQRSQRFRLILDTAPAIIFSLDSQGKFVFANKATASFYGHSIFDLKGKNAQEVIEPIDPDLNSRLEQFMVGSDRKQEVVINAFDSHKMKCVMEMSIVKFHTYDGQSILIVANDVTKRVDAEDKIENLAYFDALTNLPNRNKVYEILNGQDAHKSDSQFHVAILADLDQFKRINDTLSHSVGDQLIVKLSERLSKEFKDIGFIARLGADEFLCLSTQLSNNRAIANKTSFELAEKLRQCINKEIDIGLHRYNLSASLGVVVFRPGFEMADEILQYADTAMYESKKNGRNCTTLFQDKMATEAAELLQLERDISSAMFKDEFFFVLQPIVSSSTKKVVTAEALIRWRKGDSVISPDQFIPFLEESALIIDVGERMLGKVCELIADMRQQGYLDDEFKIAVNISGKQLSSAGFIDQVTKVLRKHQVSGHHIEFEITESVALDNMKDTIAKIQELKKLGISFSLDDFGTGYSSLSHLKDLPVDKLKIDRSFVNDINIDRQDENLVLSIIQLAQNLGLTTVAEGVETEQQVEWLKVNKSDLLQGFYFSRPIEPRDFIAKYFAKPILKDVSKR
jgi:diguanylate cyclase (GGDEF)-like protein/PAS domain S-box-containing protein